MKPLELIGSEVAETEGDELSDVYVENIYYDKASSFSRNDREMFFIGRTGSGKSAILEMIRHKKGDSARVINVSEEDFAIQLLLSSPEVEQVEKHNRQLVFKSLWKYIIITNVLKKIYGNEYHKWINFIHGDEKEAHEILNMFGELSSSQLTFTDQILNFLKKVQEVSLSSVGSIKASAEKSSSNNIYMLFKTLRRFEKGSFHKHVSRKYIYILIDDLDKNWTGSTENIDLIKCLFDTIVDLGTKFYGDLRFVVALRTDIFRMIGFHQTEKIRPYVIELKWTQWQLINIIERRLCSYWRVQPNTAWSRFPKQIDGEEVAEYFSRRSMRRPRDIISFVNLAIREANIHHQKEIVERSIKSAEQQYSRLRVEALYDEWKFVCPDIISWIDKFSSLPRRLDYQKIKSLLINESKTVKEIIDALYLVGFLGFKAGRDDSVKYSFVSKGAPGYDHIYVINILFRSYLHERSQELGIDSEEHTS